MPTNSLPVLVSDYDMKEYVKTSFSKDQLFFVRAHTRVILVAVSRATREGATGESAQFSQVV